MKEQTDFKEAKNFRAKILKAVEDVVEDEAKLQMLREEYLDLGIDELIIGEIITKAKRRSLRKLGLSPEEYSLESRLTAGETKNVEVKKSFNCEDISKTISAFCNSGLGGSIYIGLIEKDKVEDVKLKDSAKLVSNQYYLLGMDTDIDRCRCNLGAHLDRFIDGLNANDLRYFVLRVYGKQVFKITVLKEHAINRLVFYQGAAFKRIDNQNIPMTHREVYERAIGRVNHEPAFSVNFIIESEMSKLILELQGGLRKLHSNEDDYYFPDPHFALLTKFLDWKDERNFIKVVDEKLSDYGAIKLRTSTFALSDNGKYIFLNLDKESARKVNHLHKKIVKTTSNIGWLGWDRSAEPKYKYVPHFSIMKSSKDSLAGTLGRIDSKLADRAFVIKKIQIVREKIEDDDNISFVPVKEITL